MYPQEVLQREHLNTVGLSCSIAMFSRLHVSPRDLERGHMQTYILSCSIAMFSRLRVSPRDLQRGHKHANALSCSDSSFLCVPKRFFNKDTILTRHQIRNQITMTSLQISVTLLTSLMMMCCFTFPDQIV